MLTGTVPREDQIIYWVAQILHFHGKCLDSETLARLLEEHFDLRTTKKEINQLLYRRKKVFSNDQTFPLCWELIELPEELTRLTPPWSPKSDRRGWFGDVPAREWQIRALKTWEKQGRVGVIEAATGTGKSMVGIQAIFRCVKEGGRALVLVPSIVLLHQWNKVLSAAVGARNIELVGGGKGNNLLTERPVVVGVVNTVSREAWMLDGHFQLIVADECHRYGAETFQLALHESIPERMGLTATLERLDDAVEEVLSPFFSDAIYKYGFAEALKDDVVAPFRLALIAVQLSSEEMEEYKKHGKAMKRTREVLILEYGYPSSSIGEFMLRANLAARNLPLNSEEGRNARDYLFAMTRRRQILAETPAKRSAIPQIGRAIGNSRKALFFTETIDSADDVSAALQATGINARAYHTEVDSADRTVLMRRFLTGQVSCLVAVKQLDEGVDVPDAGVGVVISASKTRRQMIQRIGRVLRKKHDGSEARFAVLYAEETSEDPHLSEDDGYLHWLLQIAEETIELDGSKDIQLDLQSFFAK